MASITFGRLVDFVRGESLVSATTARKLLVYICKYLQIHFNYLDLGGLVASVLGRQFIFTIILALNWLYCPFIIKIKRKRNINTSPSTYAIK